MSQRNIIRASKDPEYRMSLSGEARAKMPENPAGPVELSEVLLKEVAGGTISIQVTQCEPSCEVMCTYPLCSLTLCPACTSPGYPC